MAVEQALDILLGRVLEIEPSIQLHEVEWLIHSQLNLKVARQILLRRKNDVR